MSKLNGIRHWHEDFGDEPSTEDQMPFGLSPEEILSAGFEAQDSCWHCKKKFATEELIETGMPEYYRMDLDPGTLICPDCLESYRLQLIPDDPLDIDCYTPVACV